MIQRSPPTRQHPTDLPAWMIWLIAMACGLVAPLGDLVENRRLVLAILVIAIVAATEAAMATNVASLLAASLLLGVGSVAVQILFPFTAHLVPGSTRGRVVGSILNGLMLGIMFARPTASVTIA